LWRSNEEQQCQAATLTHAERALKLPDVSESGFVDVATRTAGSDSLGVPGLGKFAPGAGPTIDSDGTVLLVTEQGKVIALHADGTPYWNRDLSATKERFLTSPAVGADQSVYVVGRRSALVRDHVHNREYWTNFAVLHKFTKGGGDPQISAPFPEIPRPAAAPGEYGPWLLSAPAVWRSGTTEAVIVATVYPNIGGDEVHVVAFDANGQLIEDHKVSDVSSGDVTGSSIKDEWWDLMRTLFPWFEFQHGLLAEPFMAEVPEVTFLPRRAPFRPLVAVVDRFNSQLVGYAFCTGPYCDKPGFTEVFRNSFTDTRLQSSPTPLPDSHVAVGTKHGVVFGGVNNLPSLPPVANIGSIYARPTVAKGGRLILVTTDGFVVTLENGQAVQRLRIGWTVVRPAASRTHVFVAADDGLYTLDALAETQLLKFPWFEGGLQPPAIGPDGRVYAMAANDLFIFPPPFHVPIRIPTVPVS